MPTLTKHLRLHLRAPIQVAPSQLDSEESSWDKLHTTQLGSDDELDVNDRKCLRYLEMLLTKGPFHWRSKMEKVRYIMASDAGGWRIKDSPGRVMMSRLRQCFQLPDVDRRTPEELADLALELYEIKMEKIERKKAIQARRESMISLEVIHEEDD
ncbi:hypothetical protein T439DRAFT_346566, partial [Meredithblackwellia eburnea MCA 4105]